VKSAFVGVAALSVAVASLASAQPRAAAGGTANYWMSAETVSGMGAMNQGNQGRAAMMSAMMNRASASGPSYVHNLNLQLGSPRRASGAPAAEHLPPAGLNAGPSLPLLTPEARPMPVTAPYNPGAGGGGASGRLLIYWGCGDRARAGQPVEIDLSRMSQGQVPAGLAQMVARAMNPPSAATAATYGEWPNERSRVQIPANGSLVGDHVVRGNYSPEIRFALSQGQDFLAPIAITSNSRAASGAVPVAWQSVPNARAYFLMASGARQDGTIVIWTSSEVQFSQGVYDYLSQEEIARLIQARVLLTPQTTQCTVPAEVASSVQAASLMMTAFGPEANFSTPRPASAPRNWAPDWTMKLRTRATYAGMLGQDFEAMMRGQTASDQPSQSQPQPRRRRSPLERLLGN
jgi:hypothetical protein